MITRASNALEDFLRQDNAGDFVPIRAAVPDAVAAAEIREAHAG